MQETQVVIAKPFWKSWTFWFNSAAGASVMLDWMVTQGFSFVDHPLFAAVVTGVNIALRFKTDKPIAASQKPVDVKIPN